MKRHRKVPITSWEYVNVCKKKRKKEKDGIDRYRKRAAIQLFRSSIWGKGKYLHGPPFPKFRRMRKGGGSMEEMNGRRICLFSVLLEEKQIVPGPEDRGKSGYFLDRATPLY